MLQTNADAGAADPSHGLPARATNLPVVNAAQTTAAWRAWRADGAEWRNIRDTRLQHVLADMNHHIHPVMYLETGERQPLTSCQPKHRPNGCKGGSPFGY